jgi:hypothetical protein
MRLALSLVALAMALAAFALTGTDGAAAELDWKLNAVKICETKHSYRFDHRYSSTFEIGVAGPNDSVEVNESSFDPKTGKARSASVWQLLTVPGGKTLQKLDMVATCAADPWLFPKSVAKCGDFSGSGWCPTPSCTPPNAEPPMRVPAGVFKDKPTPPAEMPHPKVAVPAPEQAYMVLEAPVQVDAGLPSGPYCSVVDVTATGPSGGSVATALPVSDGATKGTVSFVGKPVGKWMLTARVRQYTGKTGPAAWTVGPPETRGFYVGPAWPGAKEKPVSVTMLKLVSPAKGAVVPVKGGALTLLVHEDLRAAANPKRVAVTWQYLGTLPGSPWPGSSSLPAEVVLAPHMKSPSAPDTDWLTYQRPLDFGANSAQKSWKVRACIRAYDSDLCQERSFALAP